MSLAWYAINSHPNKENLLWKQLEQRGYECFYPRINVNPVNPRSRKIRPYFPGYLFVRVDIQSVGVSTFQWMPYAKSLVSFGGDPPVVPDHFIKELQTKLGEIQKKGGEFFVDIHHGDSVSVKSGPFEGYEAIFDICLTGSERVRILLKMLSDHYVPVELHVGHIEKKKKNTQK